MKRFLVVVLLTIVAPLYLFAQGAEQEVKDALSQLREAQRKGDTVALERFLADDYAFTNPFGQVMSKTETLSDLKSGRIKFETMSMDDLRVRLYGDTAVATGHVTLKGHRDERDISGQYRGTWVFVKNDGRWQVVSGQSTQIAGTAMAGSSPSATQPKAKTEE